MQIKTFNFGSAAPRVTNFTAGAAPTPGTRDLFHARYGWSATTAESWYAAAGVFPGDVPRLAREAAARPAPVEGDGERAAAVRRDVGRHWTPLGAVGVIIERDDHGQQAAYRREGPQFHNQFQGHFLI